MSYITKIEKIEKEIEIGLKCDICGEETLNSDDVNWTSVKHYHSDWGNDSVDSYELFHVCSPDCFIKQLEKSIVELDYSDTGEINDMPLEFVKNLIKYIIK